jgi:hypothetical protein
MFLSGDHLKCNLFVVKPPQMRWFFFKTISNEQLNRVFVLLHLIYRKAAVLAVEKRGVKGDVSWVKSGVMVIRFNWFTYSVIIGFLQRRDPMAGILAGKRSDAPGRGDLPFRESWQRDESRCAGERAGEAEEWKKRAWGEAKDEPWPGDHLFHLTKAIRAKLRHHIWAAGIRKQGKQDLLLSLSRLLGSYAELTVLQAHPFRVAINNVIKQETAIRCSFHLNDEELLELWRKVR